MSEERPDQAPSTAPSVLERKLVRAVLLLFLVPTVVASAIVVALYRAGALETPLALVVTGLVGLASMMGYLALLTRALGRSLVRTVHEIHLGTELIATVNPDHRLAVTTRDELEALALEINRMADRLREAQTGLEREVAHATRELEHERSTLSAMIEALGEAVVAATLGGRVILANGVARALLGDGSALLGRRLEDLFDASQAARLLHRLPSMPGAIERLALECGERTLEATLTPTFDAHDRRVGFVLVLRDVSATAPSIPVVTSAGTSSTFERAPMVGRPESYDFSLLKEMERHVTAADREHRLADLAYVVLDTETTGLEPERGDAIVSIAAVRVRGGVVKRAEVFDALVNPGRPIPASSVRFHGITDAMVAGAPTIDEVLPAVVRFAHGTVLVGHQVWFDLRFLAHAAASAGLPSLSTTHAVLDTAVLSRLVHGPLADHGLEAVAARFAVEVRGRHSALGDALATAEIFVRLLGLLAKRGISTLGAALDASHRVGRGSRALRAGGA